MPKHIRPTIAVAALAALALALPPAARAADEPPAEEGPKTLVKYAACAGGLAAASDFISAYGAIMYCVKTFFDEFGP